MAMPSAYDKISDRLTGWPGMGLSCLNRLRSDEENTEPCSVVLSILTWSQKRKMFPYEDGSVGGLFAQDDFDCFQQVRK